MGSTVKQLLGLTMATFLLAACQSHSPTPTNGLVPLQPNGEPLEAGAILLNVVNMKGIADLPVKLKGNERVFVSFTCTGSGKLIVKSLFDIQPCEGNPVTTELTIPKGGLRKLHVKVDPSTSWAMLIQRKK